LATVCSILSDATLGKSPKEFSWYLNIIMNLLIECTTELYPF
jgi:hypothetical protein